MTAEERVTWVKGEGRAGCSIACDFGCGVEYGMEGKKQVGGTGLV